MFPWNFHNMSIIFESDVKVCSCFNFNITSNKNKISIFNQIKWKNFFYKLNKKIKLKETQISIARPSKKKKKQ